MKKIFLILFLFSTILNNIYAKEIQHKKHPKHKPQQKNQHKHTKRHYQNKIKSISPINTNTNTDELLISQLNESKNLDTKISNIETNNNQFPNLNTMKRIKNLRLYSYSAIVINAKNGDVIINKNSTLPLPIASITKLMTAMVVLDSNVNLDDYVTITNDDIDTIKNTYSRLRVGMSLSRRDLLLLALMSSENRATHALARTTFQGGINAFINKMNAKALQLQMYNTKFYDPTGLTYRNTSTAYDLVRMVQKAYEYDEIKIDTTTKNANVMFNPRYVHKYVNSDALVRQNNNRMNIKLSKTGFINEAGHCLVLYTMIENKPIIMAFLNSSGKSGRLLDALTVKAYIEKDDTI
jgi:D-alanyl-D-alanine endopeptidase (penicillin-binding protein 7)